MNRALTYVNGRNDAAAKRLAGELHARLTHADVDEIFQSGLHEYLTEFLGSTHKLSQNVQASFFSSRMVE